MFVCVAALALAAAATAWAPKVTTSSPLTRGSVYLALGDSVTFGYQEPNTVPPPNYKNPASLPGYPELIARDLHVRVANLACPGETSASLINVKAQSNGCENAYRKAYPLHYSYKGSQLAAAVAFLRTHPGTRLVSLMIGANDGFICERTPSCVKDLPAFFKRVAANVTTILRTVRREGRYKGQIAIVTYYSTDYTAIVTTLSKLLNQAVVGAAKPYHVVVADGFGEFKTASVKFGNKPCLAGLITQLGGTPGNCGVHPTYAGSTLLASALLAAIRL